MSEWWTYTISDFLLFSPRTYFRLVARYNAAVWPGQLLGLAAGLVIGWLALRPGRPAGRIVAGLLAALWIWVGWAFLWRRFATINWAAAYLAWLFALEAGLLLWSGVVRGSLQFRIRAGLAGRAGLVGYGLALVGYPLAAPLFNHGWERAQVFGIMPDPTVLGTLALVIAADRRPVLLVVPGVWALVSAAMQWAMLATPLS